MARRDKSLTADDLDWLDPQENRASKPPRQPKARVAAPTSTPTPVNTDLLRARVVSSHGRHCMALDESGLAWQVFGKGKRREAAVGDWLWLKPSGDNQAWIEDIEPRRNLLYRSDAMRSKLFAANLDVVVLVLAVSPPYSPELLGRTCVACKAAGIDLEIVLNKVDLLVEQPDWFEELVAELHDLTLGEAPVHALSATADPEDARAVMLERLKGKTSLVLGQSGMGKSTLINLLIPEAKLATNEVSLALNSGKHTTTNTEMHFGADGLEIIDSPGFQAFGLFHLTPDDLLEVFEDVRELAQQCRFDDCQHREEPGCAVKEAIDTGELVEARLELYQQLLAEIQSKPLY